MTITARQIINLVIGEVVITETNGWEKVLTSVNTDLLLVHGIGLDTELTVKEA